MRRPWYLVGREGAVPHDLLQLESDALLRPLICDLVGEDVTRESPATLRDDIADIRLRLDEAERTARQLPHREKYLLLVIGFMRRFLDLHLELVDEVQRELTGEASASLDESAVRPRRRRQ